LLLITYRISYTGFRLTPIAMTLDDHEHKIGGFMDVLSDFGLRDTFQEQIAPKSLDIDQNNLQMKFSALNVDFNGPSFDPSHAFKEACARGHQKAFGLSIGS